MNYSTSFFSKDLSLSKILSNDKISTVLSDRLNFSHNVTASNPKKSLILSSGIKLIWLPKHFGLISLLLPNV